MATVNRIREHEQVERLREEETCKATMAETRLTYIPEAIQLRIISFLDTKQAIQTLLLNKSFRVCSWKSIPVLHFNSNNFNTLYDFDTFVHQVLSLRDGESVKLDKITFIHRGSTHDDRRGTSRDLILQNVFLYAFRNGVKELDIDVGGNGGGYWPSWLNDWITDDSSLTSFKLKSRSSAINCSLLKSGSGLFKSLTNLHLRSVEIKDLDPFKMLDKLTLIYCPVVNTKKGNVLNVRALRLSELTILNNYGDHDERINSCELTTPRLRYFEYRGTNVPKVITTHDDQEGGFPVLETAIVDCIGVWSKKQEKIMFDDLMMLFDTICNAKSLTLNSTVVYLLSMFPYELVNRGSPFRNLKCLKIYFRGYMVWSEFRIVLPGVKAYLLQNSQDAHTTIYRK